MCLICLINFSQCVSRVMPGISVDVIPDPLNKYFNGRCQHVQLSCKERLREPVVQWRIPFNENDEIYLDLDVAHHARHYLVSFGIFSAVLPELDLAVHAARLNALLLNYTPWSHCNLSFETCACISANQMLALLLMKLATSKKLTRNSD